MTKPKEEEFNAMWINMRFNLEQLTSQSVQILNNFQPIIDQDNSLIRFFFLKIYANVTNAHRQCLRIRSFSHLLLLASFIYINIFPVITLNNAILVYAIIETRTKV